MTRPLKIVAALIIVFSGIMEASDAAYPEGWESWPVEHSNRIPPAGEDLTALPPVVANTFKAYGWVNDAKGSAYNVRINPASRNEGGPPDGPTAVLELTDIGAIFVTEHILGEPQYGAFSIADKSDISQAHPSLNMKTCINCHTGFSDLTQAGVFALK